MIKKRDKRQQPTYYNDIILKFTHGVLPKGIHQHYSKLKLRTVKEFNNYLVFSNAKLIL